MPFGTKGSTTLKGYYIPNVPRLNGSKFFVQVAFIRERATGSQLVRLSRAIEGTIGRY